MCPTYVRMSEALLDNEFWDMMMNEWMAGIQRNVAIEAALDAVDPVPLTEEQIERMVAYATGKTDELPSERKPE